MHKENASIQAAVENIESSLKRLESGMISARQRSGEIEKIRSQLKVIMDLRTNDGASKANSLQISLSPKIIKQKARAAIATFASCNDEISDEVLHRLALKLGCATEEAAEMVLREFSAVKKNIMQIGKRLGLKIERPAEDRELIGKAKKIVMDALGIPEQIAYFIMQKYSTNTNADMTEIASFILSDFESARPNLEILAEITPEHRSQLLSKPARD